MDIYKSEKVVLTLDAGGTNFVFTALQGGRELVTPITRGVNSTNLELCLNTIKSGFEEVRSQLNVEPDAISFAFPGPADYEHGVIGNLPNFSCFNEGVPLASYLENHFKIPVYINNDGNLFAYGEAIAGSLLYVNKRLEKLGSKKRYKNLLGITFGTGFGAGVVINGHLLQGDNGCGGDIWVFRNKKYPNMIAEESVSIRGIKRVYEQYTQTKDLSLTPEDIFNIAEGKKEGDISAALRSFEEFGEVAANSIAQALTIVDGLVVIGGGITGAAKYFMPALMKEMNGRIALFSGEEFPRLQMKAYALDNNDEFIEFAKDNTRYIDSPYSASPIPYSWEKKTGVIFSQIGANKAIALGAYAYALDKITKI